MRNERNVEDLLRLWQQLAQIRKELIDRLARAELDAAAIREDVARTRAVGTTDAFAVAKLLEDLADGGILYASAALREFDRELKKRLKRATPPWELCARFGAAHAGTETERRAAFFNAVRWVTPLVRRQRARLKDSKWREGAPLPRAANATPETDGFGELGAAAMACMHARDIHLRYKGETTAELPLADAGRQIVRVLQGERVAVALTRKTGRASLRHAAAEIVASFLGIGAEAVIKAMTVD